MGREIRRVPKGWQHPTDESDKFIPIYNESFQDAFDDWYNGLQTWLNGTSNDYNDQYYTRDARGYSQYAGQSPDPDYYREQNWTEEEATCYQIYQNVSEGTPVSPVFETLADMETWLLEQGHSQKSVNIFCKEGYAPSMTFDPSHGVREDINSLGD